MSSRFVFFGTGASFTLTVFDQLLRLSKPPLAVVVPEYPPGVQPLTVSQPIFIKNTRNPLVDRAASSRIPVLYAPDNPETGVVDQFQDLTFDFILVACWPYRISREVCALADKAALNLHPSLLPKFRGANPLEQQLNSDDKIFGISLHLLSDEFDKGDIVKQTRVAIGHPANRDQIEGNAALAGVNLFIQAMDEFGTEAWQPIQQSSIKVET